jgi:hypothetical protein
MGYYSSFYNPYWYNRNWVDPYWGYNPWGPSVGVGIGFGYGPYWSSYWGYNTWFGYSSFGSFYNNPYSCGFNSPYYGNYWNRYYSGIDNRYNSYRTVSYGPRQSVNGGYRYSNYSGGGNSMNRMSGAHQQMGLRVPQQQYGGNSMNRVNNGGYRNGGYRNNNGYDNNVSQRGGTMNYPQNSGRSGRRQMAQEYNSNQGQPQRSSGRANGGGFRNFVNSINTNPGVQQGAGRQSNTSPSIMGGNRGGNSRPTFNNSSVRPSGGSGNSGGRSSGGGNSSGGGRGGRR